MNICDAQKILLHRTKRIVRELPLIFKGFLCLCDAPPHKANPNQNSNEIMRAFPIWLTLALHCERPRIQTS